MLKLFSIFDEEIIDDNIQRMNQSDTKDFITLDFSDEEIIDDNDDEIYSEDELENMNYNQSDTEDSITFDFSDPCYKARPCQL